MIKEKTEKHRYVEIAGKSVAEAGKEEVPVVHVQLEKKAADEEPEAEEEEQKPKTKKRKTASKTATKSPAKKRKASVARTEDTEKTIEDL